MLTAPKKLRCTPAAFTTHSKASTLALQIASNLSARAHTRVNLPSLLPARGVNHSYTHHTAQRTGPIHKARAVWTRGPRHVVCSSDNPAAAPAGPGARYKPIAGPAITGPRPPVITQPPS